MSDALEKAEAAAREAAQNSVDVAQIVAAVLATQQAAQPQPVTPAPAVRSEFDAKKWLTIGFLGIAGGLVAALFAVAVAIGAVSVAILALVLRSMWRDYQKGK
ncbi:FeoB-associated Cys-rich membrane protein [Streptomyces sp. NBC_01723]|uniref:FeoB-associated Cys-rich membrane protein n=1 Tax=Streptomyces sp. NBC_01723 TaxID=2975921 RepID=UPI003FCC8851